VRSKQLDVFPAYLYDARSKKDVKRHWKLVESDDEMPCALGYTRMDQHSSGTLHVLVYINEKALSKSEAPAVDLVKTYCHEAVHAAAMILEHVGESRDGETMAYLVEFIFGWLMEGGSDARTS
jgi:hypothetical protein